jgi:SNF2 family DNA or RNA helicase
VGWNSKNLRSWPVLIFAVNMEMLLTDINKQLIPVRHSCVRQILSNKVQKFGRVESVNDHGEDPAITVQWYDLNEQSVEPLSSLRCGFKINMDVQDVPHSRTRMPLGEGTVLKTRSIGNRDQVLVSFPLIGRHIWLPYENLRQVKGLKHRFILGDKGIASNAERFRLKSLAHALELWNENTGSLSHLDIDPLPHQIHLVHHILASGNLNWLIADDVGLGKTIETGMLIAALKQRGSLKRVLLITPAGLTKQWQEELQHKFKLGDFQIYGEDFQVNELRHWKMYDCVIASIDRLKDSRHLKSIKQSGDWDMIIFDEAHKLSRRQYGQNLDSSQRFKLAASLRSQTDSLILLSGTPHQGKLDKFQALLELLRPERKKEIAMLDFNPSLINEMVFRNNKSDVTDAQGNFIFRGKTTKSIQLNVSDAVLEFDTKLQSYLRKGYAAGKKMGSKGNAIGFVMTVYRKLAASSIAAILNALKNRRSRLQNGLSPNQDFNVDERDNRYSGEWEEMNDTGSNEFFDGEEILLDGLIDDLEALKLSDRKLDLFMKQIIGTIIANDPSEKVLIFTEYRATQQYIYHEIKNCYGEEKVAIINGSMSHQERSQAISSFESDGQFLISTEAGGEGINLQEKCHVMANFDLPWNPMRLVQRVGRLYRYGQKHRVVVFNISSQNTVDDQVIDLMYTRLDQVVNDMAGVGSEFNEQMHDDILGEFADLIDVNTILQEASTAGIVRTKQRIEDALAIAERATKKHIELFENAAAFVPGETQYGLTVSHEHVEAFVRGMFKFLDVEIRDVSHKGQLWRIVIPKIMQEKLEVTKSVYEVTINRRLHSRRKGTHMLDLDSFLMKYMLAVAKEYSFMGLSAVVDSSTLALSAVLTSILRWQNDQGEKLRQEYTVFGISKNGDIVANPESFSEWLKHPAIPGEIDDNRQSNQTWFDAGELAANERLGIVSNRHLHPQGNQWISGAWVSKKLTT